MSSRALRRLQGDLGLGLDNLSGYGDEDNNNEEGDDIEAVVKPKSKKKGKRAPGVVNPFELLDDGSEELGIPSDDEVDNSGGGGSGEKPNVIAIDSSIRTKKKKKAKKKQKGLENRSPSVNEQEAEDEIDAGIQEVNRILGEATLTVAHHNGSHQSRAASMKPLLHIDYRNLNPLTELKKMFGSQVVRGEQQQERNRRQRNRPVHRGSRLVQAKDTWHPTGGSGLSMKYLGEKEGFTFEHSPLYQKMQHEFCDAVESGHPEAIVSILQKHPYHIDSLVQMADFHRMNEDLQTGAEFIEKAIYGMECTFHSMFNIPAGNCYLPYIRPENRALYLCIFKHILNLGRRGCNRTAFEFCKLLLCLDPTDDPLDCMSMIDFYALRSEQYEYLIRLETEALGIDASRGVPNFAFSIALAYFKDSLKKGSDTCTKTADDRIQDALIYFPVMLMPLLDQCSVQPDKRVSSHPFFNSKEVLDNSSELGRLVTLYVKRCEPCWKAADVMSWLERNVLAVLDIVDGTDDRRIQDYAELRRKDFKKPPLSLLRHYLLSEIPGITPPQRFTNGAVLSYNPFPPPNSIISYTRPARPTVASQSQSGLIRSFLESLHPSYNPHEQPGARNRRAQPLGDNEQAEDGAVGGARALPDQIQGSIQAVMEAMRQLLNDPLAHMAGQARAEEDGDVRDNDGEWEDEEEEER